MPIVWANFLLSFREKTYESLILMIIALAMAQAKLVGRWNASMRRSETVLTLLLVEGFIHIRRLGTRR
jgi:primosomal replication protein N